MKTILVFFFALLSSFTSSLAQTSENNYYSRRYDNLDVNLIFRSARLLNNYVDCLLDKKPCPPEGKDLKRVLPEALRTRCASCTKVQKSKSLDVITRLYYQHPIIYTALAERYDPTGEYTRNFENWFDEQNAVKPRPPIPQEVIDRDEEPSNVQIYRKTTRQPSADDPNVATQQNVRRSPGLDDSGIRRSPNDLPTERTRIPSTWITSTTRTTTQRPVTLSRAPLRTTQPSVRASVYRDPVMVTNRAATPTTARPQFQPLFPPIDNIFAPRPNGPINRSINKLLDTTEKVVAGFAGMFRSTLEIITGTG